jgi:hypothetical protein
MEKVLYISVVSNIVGGGMAGLDRNYRVLSSLNNITLIDKRVSLQSTKDAVISLFSGGNFNLSRKSHNEIINTIKKDAIDTVFIESTLAGSLVKAISKYGVRTIVFAHNVESVLYEERFFSSKSIVDWAKMKLVKWNEKKSIDYAETVVSLTDRDSNELEKRYGRRADMLIPVSFPSRYLKKVDKSNGLFCLFVGSDFFPNNEGISWFINNVMPFVNIELRVAGSCCRAIKSIPDSVQSRIKLLGIVDNLEELYLDAAFVVAPIFNGSGMKTKTIEALSYGKTIVGTDESFQGIECNYDCIGGLCNTDKEFIECINKIDRSRFNKSALDTFENNYSDSRVSLLFSSLFDNTVIKI